MNKQAGIGKVLTGAFIANDAVEGVKKTGRAFNAGNPYDAKLGTTVSKAVPKSMGIQNASISSTTKAASEELDYLCKEAGIKDAGKAIAKGVRTARVMGKRKLRQLDSNNTKHIKGFVDGIKEKNVTKTMQEGANAAKVTVPAAIGMVGAGVGASKLLKKLDNNPTPEKDLEYNTMGATLAGGLALAAMANKKMLKPGQLAGDILKEKAMKYPLQAAKRSSKSIKFVGDVASQAAKGANKAIKTKAKANVGKVGSQSDAMMSKMYDLMNGRNPVDIDKAKGILIEQQKNRFIKNNVLSGMNQSDALEAWEKSKGAVEKQVEQVAIKFGGLIDKKASDQLDMLEKMAKVDVSKIKNNKNVQYGKKLVVDHFFKKGLESIPWFAAPATLGYMLDRDLRNGMQKNEHLEDISDKTASAQSKAKDVLKLSLEKGAEGLGRTVFPATVTAVTGKNIMNSFRDIKEEERLRTVQEDMANKIVIQIDGDTNSKRAIKKEFNSKLNEALNKHAAYDIGDVLSMLSEETDKATEKKKKMKSKKIHIGMGVKKQFRMNE